MRKLFLGLIALGAVVAMVYFGYGLVQGPLRIGDAEPKFVYGDTTTPENVTASSQVKVGEMFIIHLGSNPTTGYDWIVRTGNSIRFLGYTTTGGGRLPGAPVERDYSFRALEQGDETITLIYARALPAFTKEHILKTIVLRVKVTG